MDYHSLFVSLSEADLIEWPTGLSRLECIIFAPVNCFPPKNARLFLALQTGKSDGVKISAEVRAGSAFDLTALDRFGNDFPA